MLAVLRLNRLLIKYKRIKVKNWRKAKLERNLNPITKQSATKIKIKSKTAIKIRGILNYPQWVKDNGITIRQTRRNK